MMGQQPRTEPLFYYFRLEDQIPDDHLLKRLDRCVDFRPVRERLRDAYSPSGCPSIDPEILLRMLVVGYLYGISSERRPVEEALPFTKKRGFAPKLLSIEHGGRCRKAPAGTGAARTAQAGMKPHVPSSRLLEGRWRAIKGREGSRPLSYNVERREGGTVWSTEWFPSRQFPTRMIAAVLRSSGHLKLFASRWWR